MPYVYLYYGSPTRQGDPVFDTIYTGHSFNSSNATRDVNAADLNADGLLDLIVLSYSSNPAKYYVLIQKPDGSFGDHTTYSTNNYSGSKYFLDDVNNDGAPDLITRYNYPSRVGVQINYGLGNFPNPTYYSVTNYNNRIATGDVDSDGDIDIVATSGNSSLSANRISILKNNGNGTFASQITMTQSNMPGSYIHLNDIDKDGDLDMVLQGNSSFGGSPKIIVYKNDSFGAFTEFTSYVNDSRYGVNRDFDGDNFNDLITFDNYNNNPNYAKFWKGSGDGNFNSGITIDTMFYGPVGDIDGDNDFDVFGYCRKESDNYVANLYFNDGNAQFSRSPVGRVTGSSLILCDIDNDGDLDLPYITVDNKVCIALNKPEKLYLISPRGTDEWIK
ncbi:MAG: VCBS repeat-containing protein [Bacteroidetes bacterium]|nr:VCBS repeat-containing protein [Bacteroidota bacterium]